MNALSNSVTLVASGFAPEVAPGSVRLRRLLVALDFSASSFHAYHYAMALAECFGGELSLLHVIPPSLLPEWGYAHLTRRDEQLKSVARSRLEAFVRSQSPPAGRVKQLHVRAGDPHLQIPEAARESAADLIVIATHGESLVPHCLLGNTAEAVVRRAPCPVWVVPGVTSGDAALEAVLLPPRRVLVATDFSAESRKAIRYGGVLAREFDASLHLVHVVPTLLPADVSHLTSILQETSLQESAMRELARMRAEELPGDLLVVTKVLCGNPFLEIDKEALRVCAGLIIVSTHGRTGLRYLLLGCTAQHFVQHASVPVLVVREHEPEFVPITELGKEKSL